MVRFKSYVVWGAGHDAAQLTESGQRLFANIVHDLARSPAPDLELLAKVSGRLLDPAGSGMPGAAIHVERYRPGEEARDRGQEAYEVDSRTRSDGSFLLSNLEPGAYRLEARYDGFEPLVVDPLFVDELHAVRQLQDRGVGSFVRRKVEIEVTGTGDEVLIELTPGTVVSGRLLGFDAGGLTAEGYGSVEKRIELRSVSHEEQLVLGHLEPDSK